MIEILAVWKYKEKLSNIIVLLFLLLHIFIYSLTRSRMSLVVSIIITLSLIVLKSKFLSSKVNNKLSIIAYFITPIFTIASVVFMLMVRTNSLVSKIDLYFSNRFGLHF